MRIMNTRVSIAVLAVALPIAALADASNNETLSKGQNFSFDTGAIATSGGDIDFTGTTITFVGTAAAFSFGNLGSEASTEYGTLSTGAVATLQPYVQTPINAAANDLFVVATNGGHFAKVWITAASSSSLSFTYTAFGVTGTSNIPAISAVQDAGSYSANLAQGGIFVVKGTQLCAPGLVEPSFPLPMSSPSGGEGVTIGFTPLEGGTTTLAYIIYLYNENGVNQLAGVVPSTLPTGAYNVVVTYSGSTSAPYTVQVVKEKPELFTQDSSGNGLVVVQNYISPSQVDVNRYTTGTANGSTISPAHPGQIVIAWLTGLGPVPYADNAAAPTYNFAANGANIQVIVGGMMVTPSYAGSAPGTAGEDQIDFTLPANVPTGCTVSLQISEDGNLSQQTFVSIAPVGANACVQSGFTTSQLQQFDDGLVLNYGSFSIIQSSQVSGGQNIVGGMAEGSFVQVTGDELPAVPPQILSGYTPPTGCTVTQIPVPVSYTNVPGYPFYLDAGGLTLTGPSGSRLNGTAFQDVNSTYSLSISGQGSPVNGTIVPGAYTLNGFGGTQVGQFSANLTLPTPLAVTGGLPSVVNRSSGLTLNWTGGNASDGVVIRGSAETVSNNGSTFSGATFQCFTTVGAGTYTIGSSILNQLPAISAAQIAGFTGITSLAITSGGTATAGNGLFNAPLVAGGTIANATFAGSISFTVSPAYQ